MFKKIFLGYLSVLLISFFVLALAFTFTVRQYLINDTVESLYRAAEMLGDTARHGGAHGSGMMRGAYFSLANRIGYADFLLLSQENGRYNVLASSDPDAFAPGSPLNEAFLENLAFKETGASHLVEKNLVAVALPARVSEVENPAVLILYAELTLLTQLNRSLIGLLGIALLAGGLVSVFAGALSARVVIGPLKLLRERASALAGRDFSGRIEINSGDELQELADSFNEMARQLEAHDRAQQDFFQKASHELKTPLMSVQGYAEAIKDGVLPAGETEAGLNIIIREAGRMKNLVEELIYLSRAEAFEEKISLEPLKLNEAALEAVQSLKSLALEKKISLQTNFSGQEVQIMGDSEKLHRLLLNLIANALRHGKKEVIVTVSGFSLIVEDDGEGFTGGEEELAFNPFYRGQKGGTGLGLSISRAIAAQHGAVISAENRPGGGARVRVSFP